MQKLLPALKAVSIVAVGMVSVSAFMLLATYLIMPGSLPHVASQWFFVLAGGAAGILVTFTAAVNVFVGWQEAEADAKKSRQQLSRYSTVRPQRQPLRE